MATLLLASTLLLQRMAAGAALPYKDSTKTVKVPARAHPPVGAAPEAPQEVAARPASESRTRRSRTSL